MNNSNNLLMIFCRLKVNLSGESLPGIRRFCFYSFFFPLSHVDATGRRRRRLPVALLSFALSVFFHRHSVF
jgi:hypothetical protein